MEHPWTRAVTALGGSSSGEVADELVARYAEPHRRYHGVAHVTAVLRDSDWLAAQLGLSEEDRAVLTLAAAAHDVVYNGVAGDDEHRSAEWARDRLTEAGVAERHVVRVVALILATVTHEAAEDVAAQVLLDADLAILGAEAADYDRYRTAVREEYAKYDDETWRQGRTAVVSGLLARDPLYGTEPARARWSEQARINLSRELIALG